MCPQERVITAVRMQTALFQTPMQFAAVCIPENSHQVPKIDEALVFLCSWQRADSDTWPELRRSGADNRDCRTRLRQLSAVGVSTPRRTPLRRSRVIRSASRQLVYPYVVCGETTINHTVYVTHHHHASLLKYMPRRMGGAHTAPLHGLGARAAPHGQSAHSELVVLRSNAEQRLCLCLPALRWPSKPPSLREPL